MTAEKGEQVPDSELAGQNEVWLSKLPCIIPADVPTVHLMNQSNMKYTRRGGASLCLHTTLTASDFNKFTKTTVMALTNTECRILVYKDFTGRLPRAGAQNKV